jgi:peptidoglycan/xylan/chitin deacetylase (PgdA/CDA1 family)
MNLLKYRLAQVVSATNFLPNRSEQSLRRVLMYHSVAKDADIATTAPDIYSISETYFSSHVNLLTSQNKSGQRKVVSLEDSDPHGVSITFDDGYNDTLTIAAPLLLANNLPFHVFVTPENITSGSPRYLSSEGLIALSKIPGATIGAHGFSHQHLDRLSPTKIIDELKSSKEWLENKIGKSVLTMSYPHGAFNLQVKEIAASVGYLFAATSSWGCYKVGTSPLQIPRIDIWNLDNKNALQQKLDGKWDWLKKINKLGELETSAK